MERFPTVKFKPHKKGFGGHMFSDNGCDWCREEDKPVKKHPRTKEYLCDECYYRREIEPIAQEKYQEWVRVKADWDRLRNV